MYFWRINDGPLQSHLTTPACKSHNENCIDRLVGVTKSSKFQALQVQLLIKPFQPKFLAKTQ